MVRCDSRSGKLNLCSRRYRKCLVVLKKTQAWLIGEGTRARGMYLDTASMYVPKKREGEC